MASPTTIDAELVLDAQTTLGEGAMWYRDHLLWVDIEQNKLFVYDPLKETNTTFNCGQMVSAVVPRASGGVVVSLHHGFAFVDTNTGEIEIITDPQDGTTTRFNHGADDPDGRFWAGTIDLQKPRQPVAGLYIFDTDETARKILDGVTNSNGFAFNKAADRFYYIDTSTKKVDVFDYDRGAVAISNRRTLKEIPAEVGHPDGMTIDADDNLWVALYAGSGVLCLDGRTGEELARISVPAPNVTSCSFGGPNLDELYITTARSGMSEEAIAAKPLSGGLFKAKPGVKGVPVVPYAG